MPNDTTTPPSGAPDPDDVAEHVSDIMFDPRSSPEPDCVLCQAGVTLGTWADWDVSDPFQEDW